MPLLNYTTEIASAKTASEVQLILAKAGAQGVAMQYQNAQPVAVAFTAMTPLGMREFTLPIHWEQVLLVLRKQKVSPRLQTEDQARRVAWRIVKDWIEAQLAIIQTEMVTIDQVMLPYMRTDDGRTVYEAYRDKQLQLTAGGAG